MSGVDRGFDAAVCRVEDVLSVRAGWVAFGSEVVEAIARAAREDVAELEATVARVEGLIDPWMRNEQRGAEYQDGLADAAEQLRAAIASDEP